MSGCLLRAIIGSHELAYRMQAAGLEVDVTAALAMPKEILRSPLD